MSSRSILLLSLYVLFSCCPKTSNDSNGRQDVDKGLKTTTWNSWSRSGARSNETAQIKILSVVNLKNLVSRETHRICTACKTKAPVTTAYGNNGINCRVTQADYFYGQKTTGSRSSYLANYGLFQSVPPNDSAHVHVLLVIDRIILNSRIILN